ncbi:LptA/OstA family protein [Prochlorococcus sp. MIT 1201]|uniref:LptA/OstA family protein n=1 Tax=Prochlorococcus sp. MIT 1201 TaxID=3082535 RepID=UPI0039A58BA2
MTRSLQVHLAIATALVGISTPAALSQEGSPSAPVEDGGLITIESDIQNADSVTGVFTAIGNVRIVYPARGIVATSRQAQYFSKEDRVVLSGDVDVIRDGENSMQAERVVYLLEEEQGVADPRTGTQVFTSVQLNSNKQAEGPLAQ